MSDFGPIYCAAQTHRATRFEPAEWCETEVEQEGDFCPRHDEDDRSDDAYERFREDQRRES